MRSTVGHILFELLALVLCPVLVGQSKLPAPKLDPVFDLRLQLSGPTDVGQTGAGLRRGR